MRGFSILAAALLAVPVTASPPLAFDGYKPVKSEEVYELSPEGEVWSAVRSFFSALRHEDKTKLATMMLPEGVIFIHDKMEPKNPRFETITVAKHLDTWANSSRRVDEIMREANILVDGDMAHVWGPYTFWVDNKVNHCGINSLSLVKTKNGWKVGNTSFTMEPPSECERLGAPGRTK